MNNPLRVLIIDDDELDALVIKHSLLSSRLPVEFEHVLNAEKGIERIKKSEYDIILLDYKMPDTRGLFALKKIKKRNPEATVILITSLGDEKIASESILAGAADYISKTMLTPESLSQSILRAMKFSQVAREKEDAIKALIHSEAQLRKANEAAARSAKAKQDFLALISHEIRTPLNSITGYSELLRETSLNQKQRNYLQPITHAGQTLLTVINDLLDLSKLEAGKFEFDPSVFNIYESVAHTLNLLKPNLRKKNLTLILKIDPAIPTTLTGDAMRLNQVLLNLVSNAIKFTERGKISVSVDLLRSSEKNVLLEFTIADTGIGIPGEKLNSIFEAFTQAAPETARKFGGTGLGLALVKKLVELQGGEISVASKVNKGTIFNVRLRFGTKGVKKHTGSTWKAGLIPDDLMGIKILVAEDNPMNQKLILNRLQTWNCRVDIAPDGETAIKKAMNKKYKLILMDIQLPGINGIKTMQQIRKMRSGNNPRIPIIALSAQQVFPGRQSFQRAGFDDFITKPFQSQELLRKIRFHLGFSSENGQNHSRKTQLDLTFLRKESMGDPVILADLLRIFNTNCNEFIRHVKNDLLHHRWAGIASACHKIKANLKMVGANELGQIVNEVEELALQKKKQPVILQKTAIFEQLFSELKKITGEEIRKLSAGC